MRSNSDSVPEPSAGIVNRSSAPKRFEPKSTLPSVRRPHRTVRAARVVDQPRARAAIEIENPDRVPAARRVGLLDGHPPSVRCQRSMVKVRGFAEGLQRVPAPIEPGQVALIADAPIRQHAAGGGKGRLRIPNVYADTIEELTRLADHLAALSVEFLGDQRALDEREQLVTGQRKARVGGEHAPGGARIEIAGIDGGFAAVVGERQVQEPAPIR